MPRSLRGLVLAGALVLAGCGVGGQQARDGADEPELTKEQLAMMVLPEGELADGVAALQADGDVGVVDNRQAADDSIDPDDTAKSLRSAGRLTGYKLSHSQPKLLSAKAKGVLGVGSMVEVMEDPVYAAQYLHARLNDYEAFRKAIPGLKLSNHSTFEAPIGDEAGGQRVKFTLPGVLTGHSTEVYFRRGRIVASVEVVRGDRRDAQEEVLRLAAELDQRIQAVLAGKRTPPEKPAKPESTGISAAERQALPAQTLAAADLAAAATVIEEKETDSDEDSVSFLRGFEDVDVGGSHLMRLNAQTTVYEDPEDAALAFKIAAKGAGREIFADSVVRSYARQTGVRPTDVRVRPLPSPGKGMAGVVVTFELVGAKFELVSIFMRSGNLVQSVTGICRPNELDPSDLKTVARLAYDRMVA
jgi:hypothetical protein